MKFVSFEKEYPRYNAYTEDNKKAYIQVDAKTKTVIIYGISGRPVAAKSVYSKAFSENKIMNLLVEIAKEYNDEKKNSLWNYYLYVDSCTSLNIKPLSQAHLQNILEYNRNIKFSDVIKIQQKQGLTSRYDIVNFLFNTRLDKQKQWREEEKQLVRDIKDSYSCINNCKTEYCFEHPEIITRMVKWLNSSSAKILGYNVMVTWFSQYLNIICELEDDEFTIKDDFWQSYLESKEQLDKKTEAIFKRNQLQRNLVYENDTFLIIVPTTRDELEFEGSRLHNCLNGYEWNNFLKNGTRQVVFIHRKSEPKKPYIACDISKSGKIMQYLTYCNNYVKEQDAKDFKREYQNYLLSIYTKPIDK